MRIIFFCAVTIYFLTCRSALCATIYWNSDNSGDWYTASNWSGGVLPGPNDDVIIDRPNANITVTLGGTGGLVNIQSITCAETLTITGSNAELTVTQPSNISGELIVENLALLRADGAALIASGTGRINNGYLAAVNAGQLLLDGITEYTIGIADPSNLTYRIYADGLGSQVRFQSLINITIAGTTIMYSNLPNSFLASNGGIIDISSVTTINATGAPFQLLAEAGGQIDLSGATSIVSLNGSIGVWEFTATYGARIDVSSFPVFDPFSQNGFGALSIVAENNGEVDFSSLTALSARGTYVVSIKPYIDAPYMSSMRVNTGGRILVPNLVSVRLANIDDNSGLPQSIIPTALESITYSMLAVANNSLNLPALTDITHTCIEAVSGAQITLPAIVTTTTSCYNATGSNSLLSMPNLRSIIDAGWAGFSFLNPSIIPRPIRAENEGRISLPMLETINIVRDIYQNFVIEAVSGGIIEMPSLKGILDGLPGTIRVSAIDLNSRIDLPALCAMSPEPDALSGNIITMFNSPAELIQAIILGIRYSTSGCGLADCPNTRLFSMLSDGSCLYDLGPVAVSSVQNARLDGIMISNTGPIYAFLNTGSSSTMVQLKYGNNSANFPVFPFQTTLPGRTITGAASISGVIHAIDAANNQLIRVNNLGNILGTPVQLTLAGNIFDLSEQSDIAVNGNGNVFLADRNAIYRLNTTTGVLIQYYADTEPLSSGQLPDFSGIVFGTDSTRSFETLVQLNTASVDQIFATPSNLLRDIFVGPDPFGITSQEPNGDAIVGDLARIQTQTQLPPPPVVQLTAAAIPSTQSALLDWTGYNENLFGGVITGYRVYRSNTAFTSTTQATLVTVVPAGVQSYTMTNVPNSETTYVAVVAVALVGGGMSTVQSVSVLTNDTEPPPSPVINTITSGQTTVAVSWFPVAAADLNHYDVYLEGANVSGSIPASTTSYAVAGLNPNSGYNIAVTATDNAGNESPPTSLFVPTLIDNPANLIAVPDDQSIQLSWSYTPTSVGVFSTHSVFVSQQPFTSVLGMTPHTSTTNTSLQISNLQNNTTYYVAVVAVNILGQFNPIVIPISVVPVGDITGPTFSSPMYAATPLLPNTSISASAIFEITVVDESLINRIDFLFDGSLIGSNSGVSSGTISNIFLDISETANGLHSLGIFAIDVFGNSSQLAIPVIVAHAPPAPPQIVAPVNNLTTNSPVSTVFGTSELNTTVNLFVNGQLSAPQLTVSQTGQYSGQITLNEGQNVIHAVAVGIGGESQPSASRTIVLDTSLPAAPLNFIGESLPAGELRLTWGGVVDAVSYELYRSTSQSGLFANNNKINLTPIVGTSYLDLPPSDGDYYYGVLGVNILGTLGEPSAAVLLRSDRTLPVVTSISYLSTGQTDPTTNRFGPGFVSVTVSLSEELSTTPFLNFGFSSGAPIVVPLIQVAPQLYEGSFVITTEMLEQQATALFSGYDLVNNRGTVVLAGGSFVIDNKGPNISAIMLSPTAPILNTGGAAINATVQLSEPPAAGTMPTFSYQLSGSGTQPTQIINVTSVAGNTQQWILNFNLPVNAGLSVPENLSFSHVAIDDLGNQGTITLAPNIFQVYQGNLPPLNAPQSLQATPRPGGAVQLTWSAVLAAAGYQVYRREPNGGSLTPLGGIIATTELLDATPYDGSYDYAVASVRVDNGQQAISAPGVVVTVVSDSISPQPPTNLSLLLSGAGVSADWGISQSALLESGINYRVYRDDLPPNVAINLTGLTPIGDGIAQPPYIDVAPNQDEHAYAVSAIDVAGNESMPSNTEYLNFSLLPVSTLGITVQDGGFPTINWTYASSAASVYRVRLVSGQTVTQLYEGTDLSYIDTGYAEGGRRYSVVAVDSLGVESVAREIAIPDITRVSAEPITIMRGVLNTVQYEVTNNSAEILSQLRVRFTIGAEQYSSQQFQLMPAEVKAVPIVIPGELTLSDQEDLLFTVEQLPNVGEFVELIDTKVATVTAGGLLLSIEGQNLLQGATGQLKFAIENTSNAATEIVMARANGSQPSDEIRFKIVDSEGTVFATAPVQQILGVGVVTLPNGVTVARILPGERYESDWTTIQIPSAAPLNVAVRLEIDALHNRLSTPEHVEIVGPAYERTFSLSMLPYTGEILSITPATTFGGEDIVISGRLLSSLQSVAYQPLDLVLRVNGFEYIRQLTSDANGEFEYLVLPEQYARGAYVVSAVFPGSADRPNHGQFVIEGLTIAQTNFTLNAPRNYYSDLSIGVTAGPATEFNNLRIEYRAEDQLLGRVPEGIQIDLPPSVTLAAGSSHLFNLRFAGDSTAQVSGLVRLRVISDQNNMTPLGMVEVLYTLSQAAPSLRFIPAVLESGANQGTTANERILLKNEGLAPLTDATVELLSASGGTLPYWIYITSSAVIPRIEVGEQVPIDLIISPDSSVASQFYFFILRVTSPNEQPREMPITIAVTQNGVGNLLVHASDIYTGTTGPNNLLIPGLDGALIRLQHTTISNINFSGTTDMNGEVRFDAITAGEYYLRGSAPGHQDRLTTVNIAPGVTRSSEVFLQNNVLNIQWSVQEITIKDYYQINLQATYQTNVPVAVVVMNPPSIQLPQMSNGDVFYGEFTITNHGLINAVNVLPTFPPSDGRTVFEFLQSVPQIIYPNQIIVVPYRIRALQDFNFGTTTIGDLGGSGGCVYTVPFCINYQSICINGQIFSSSACTNWFYTQSCTISGGGGGGGIIYQVQQGGGAGSWSPGGTTLFDLSCVPDINCSSSSAGADR